MGVTRCSQCDAKEGDTPFGRCVCGLAYCGARCQKAGWPSHKQACPTMVPREVEGRGLGMIATRRSKQGDILATEQPVIKVTEAFSKEGKERFVKTFAALEGGEKEKLLSLYDPGAESRGPWISGHNADADRAWRVFYSNGIGVGTGTETVTTVYPTLSRINHSCRCNTHQRCHGESKSVTVIAGRDLVKGEEVTLNYLGPTSILLSREERQARLSKGWFFTCSCNICSLQGEKLQINQNIRSTLANFKDQIEYIISSPTGYMSGKLEARKAFEEEKKKAVLMEKIATAVVAALGPECVFMLKEELETTYFSFKKNMSDISYYL